MELRPENRMEQILAGENITPENRAEAFTKEAIDNAGGGGGGVSITVDSALSGTSENPVQNKAINAAIAELQAAIEAVNNDYKVTLTATVDEQTQQAVITVDKTVAEIYAAAAAGKHCFAVIELAPGTYRRYELNHYSALQVTFYGVEMDEEGSASIAKPVVIEGAATGGDHDEWTVID